MRCLCFLFAVLMVFAYGCAVEKEHEEAAPREKVVSLDCGALEEAAEGYVPVPSGYLNAASVSKIQAVRADELAVSIENHLSRSELDVVIKLMIDHTDYESGIVSAPPGGKADIVFKLPVTVLEGREIAAVIEPLKPEDLPEWEEALDFGQRYMVFEPGEYEVVPRVSFKAGADGCIAKWDEISHIFIRPDTPGGITAQIYTGWEGDYFRLAVSVSDEKHFNTKSGSGIWDGDSLQFAFAPPGDVEPFNLGLALASGSIRTHKWRGPETGLFEKSEYTVLRDDEAGKTVYELKMPLELLKIEPEKGAMFGFNAVVFDDDDGEGQEYWLQITPGIAGGWDVREFREFILL